MATSLKDTAVSTNRNRDRLMTHHGFQVNHLEDAVLQGLDGAVAPLLRRLWTAEEFNLDSAESLRLVEFLAHQMTRSAFQLERWEAHLRNEYGANILEGLNQYSVIGDLHDILASSHGALSEKDVLRHFALSNLRGEVTAFLRHLAPRTIRLYRTDSPLVTGDEPVVPLFESMDTRFRSSVCTAPIVAFPVSKHRVLMLFHPAMPALLPDGEMLTAAEVQTLNVVIAGNATSFAYGDTDSRTVATIRVPRSRLDKFNDKSRSGQSKDDIRWADPSRWIGSRFAPRRPVLRLWPWHATEVDPSCSYASPNLSPAYSMP